MKTKEFNNNVAKAQSITSKIDTLVKERDNILLQTTALFTKGQSINFLDKDGNKQEGKVLYNVGQKSLTVVTKANTKVNVNLTSIVFA
jgi:hypothetical protein